MNSTSGRPIGVLNVNKPRGLTSRDVVNRIARPLRKIKVGHAGTLDPLASGVLVVCVGGATRLIEYVQDATKTYRTVIRLGATSNTLDADGEITEHPDAPVPALRQILELLPNHVGEILQVPPQFSALKVQGQRAYDLARAGQTVELAARPVQIDRVELMSYAWPLLELEIDCGGGTYIRSIARDLGEQLGCGGLIEVLIRTRIGAFTLGEAIELDRLDDRASVVGHLRPAVDALGGMPRFLVDANQQAALLQGRSIAVEGLPSGEVALMSEANELIAIAEADPATGTAAPRRVLAGA